jgi:hypothetical protein
MALKVVWSKTSEKELIKTLLYWKEKNQSNTYSKKLFSELISATNLMAEFPNLGFPTSYQNNRILVSSNYKLIFEATKTQIKIKRFFDTRRNPKLINKFS